MDNQDSGSKSPEEPQGIPEAEWQPDVVPTADPQSEPDPVPEPAPVKPVVQEAPDVPPAPEPQPQQEQYHVPPQTEPQQQQGQYYVPPQQSAPQQSIPVNDGGLPDWMRQFVIYNGGNVPANAKGWGWAPFFWNFIYFFVRGQWKIAVGVLIAFVVGWALSSFGIGFIVNIAVVVFSGIYGRRLAFVGATPGRFPTDEALQEADKPWVIVGVVLVALGVIFTILGFILFAGWMAAMMGTAAFY